MKLGLLDPASWRPTPPFLIHCHSSSSITRNVEGLFGDIVWSIKGFKVVGTGEDIEGVLSLCIDSLAWAIGTSIASMLQGSSRKGGTILGNRHLDGVSSVGDSVWAG